MGRDHITILQSMPLCHIPQLGGIVALRLGDVAESLKSGFCLVNNNAITPVLLGSI